MTQHIEEARKLAEDYADFFCQPECVDAIAAALAAAEERGRSEERERIRFDMIVGLRHWFNDRYGKWITFKSAKTLATYVFKEPTP